VIWLFALIALVWLALMPPLFTAGACTREFDATTRRVEDERKRLASSTYDSRDRLTRMQMEMKSYQSLPLPVFGTALHWAR
jgi:hypothetical protein